VKREFKINNSSIGQNSPVYFIADVAANHDGDIQKAKELIYMVAENGGHAAKFQHFAAKTIVSDYGFNDLGNQQSHQSSWKKSVFDVYSDASLNPDWTPVLAETCKKAGIDFFTSPYSFELVDLVNPLVPAFKVGSGDITWHQIIEYMAKKEKPMLLATGASRLDEVVNAVNLTSKHCEEIVLMQCNTNYTGSLENFKYINLNVLKVYREIFPDIVLGLSDHTPGHATVLGSVAMGARVIEKHFTDDNNHEGPDHAFSMNPQSWKEMVDRTKELEYSLGDGFKTIEGNEKETVCLQRRSIRLVRDMKEGEEISANDLEVLRPCPEGAILPYDFEKVLGKKLINRIEKGKHITWQDLR
jgi:sialic acid synthase SpsE